VGDPDLPIGERVDAVAEAHDAARDRGLVHEAALGLDLEQAELERILAVERERPDGAGLERAVERDALDGVVPRRPGGDVAVEPPDRRRAGGGLDGVPEGEGERRKHARILYVRISLSSLRPAAGARGART
jgi:hypothetical protein